MKRGSLRAPGGLLLTTGARFAILGGGAGRDGDEGTGFKGCLVGEGHVGHVVGATCERNVLAQGIKGVAVPHEDTAQIGMIGEADAHHVEDFAFVPVGVGPEVGDGGPSEVTFGDAEFEAEVIAAFKRVAHSSIRDRRAAENAVIKRVKVPSAEWAVCGSDGSVTASP